MSLIFLPSKLVFKFNIFIIKKKKKLKKIKFNYKIKKKMDFYTNIGILL
jgi:hypothetical protein